MKKMISGILILSFIVSMGNGYFLKKEIFGAGKKAEYVVQINDTTKFKKEMKEQKEAGNFVVTHTDQQEKYLNENNTMVVNLSKNELEEYKTKKDVIIEEDGKVKANVFVPEKNPFADSEGEIQEENDTAVTAVEIDNSYYEKGKKEYSDDPKSFIPSKSVKNKKEDNEVVPWNISCVAGTPEENKYKGKKIKVAVIDSGIDVHNELNTKAWIDFSDTVEGYKPIDSSGHGTTVAGVIGAQINGIGIEGIASEAELYSLKVLDQYNEASVSTVIKALEWCIENDIDVINMSFGLDTPSKLLEQAIQKAYNKNIIMVSAAGNNNSVQYPAKYDEVLSVGSIDENLQASDFSANTKVDFVAPGENVQTIGYVGSYCNTAGTSIAAAHVTGVVAAVKSANRKMSNEQLCRSLYEGSLVLADGSRLVNYENTIQAIRNNKANITLKKVKRKTQEIAEDESSYVNGSWVLDHWYGTTNGTGSGHYSLINSLPLSYFSSGASSETEKIHHRWIVADSAYRTDSLDMLKAGSKNDAYNTRNANGEMSSTGIYLASPYHAKTDYSVDEVVSEHLFFLYELARRRLVLNSNLDMTATNYSGNSYYGVSIPLNMKRRIIVDMRALYNDLTAHYSGTGINMTEIKHRGYMVLGVFLHLVQDIQAHRAKCTMNMLYEKSDGTVYFGYDVFGANVADCRINGDNIKGVKNGKYDDYWKMYEKVKAGKLPLIRLKNYLREDNFTINCNGVNRTTNAGGAYEDNPFFYSARYETSISFSRAYIDRILNDTGSQSSQLTSYFADSRVPLANWK